MQDHLSAVASSRFSQVSFAVALCLSLGAVQQTQAAPVVDQQQTAQTVEGVALLPSWTSIGQSFVPQQGAIDWAEFLLRAETSTPVSISVSVLDGVTGSNGLGGTVLGTSETKLIGFLDSLAAVLFDFTTPLALTAGNTYVLRLNLQSSGTLKFGSTFNSAYTDGQMFQSPYSPGLLSSQDLYFREGTTASNAVPEPTTLLLAALGLTGLAATRRRAASQRRSSPLAGAFEPA